MIKIASNFLERAINELKNTNFKLKNPLIIQAEQISIPKDEINELLAQAREYFVSPLSKTPFCIKRGDKVLIERNLRVLRDESTYFVLKALNSFESSKDGGILAFISNNGFIDNATARAFRFWLMQNLDEIYILNLHGNTRKREYDAQGAVDENPFSLMNGASISVFVKKSPQKSLEKLADVYCCDILGSRARKLEFLQKASLKSENFIKINPHEPYFFFNNDSKQNENYCKFYGIADIFDIHGSGIQSGNDSLLVAMDELGLKAKISAHYGSFNPKSVQKIMYRPYDLRYVYYDNKIQRPRTTLMRHLLGRNNLALHVSRQAKLSGAWDFCFVSEILTQRCLLGGGNTGAGIIWPLYVYDQNGNASSNIGLFFLEKLSKICGREISPKDAFCYIYATLNHKIYRAKYENELKLDFARVPLPKDDKCFEKLCDLGSKLIDTQLLKNLKAVNFEYKREKNDEISSNPLYAKGGIFINSSLFYPCKIDVWQWSIGGGSVLVRYLKARKGLKLDKEYFGILISLASRSLELTGQISAVSFTEF